MSTQEVVALAGWPPEILAYAFAMYSRSSLSIRESIAKITAERSAKFFETYYFQYSHASIADNAHVPLAFENIPQLAAFELEDEQLWDGQERSTRYQLFKKENVEGYFVPASIRGTPVEPLYHRTCEKMLGQYERYTSQCFEHLAKKYPKPPEMKQDDYERTIRARAFDIARYFLFNGIKTSVGQITSARTLASQLSRLGASRYPDIRELSEAAKQACLNKPFCPEGKDEPPVAPTLIKHAEPSEYLIWLRSHLAGIVERNASFHLDFPLSRYVKRVVPKSATDEILGSLIYESSHVPYAAILGVLEVSRKETKEQILREVMERRGKYDPLPRAFAEGMKYQFDVLMDVGGRRDLHRHRNCIQLHQHLTIDHGWDTPPILEEMGLKEDFFEQMIGIAGEIHGIRKSLGDQEQDADYLIPFAFRAGTLYKMHLAQLIYMTELRSGVKGHFSYREVACQMDEQLRIDEPFFDGLTQVTPFSKEDALTR